jgi:hypothetical protein
MVIEEGTGEFDAELVLKRAAEGHRSEAVETLFDQWRVGRNGVARDVGGAACNNRKR